MNIELNYQSASTIAYQAENALSRSLYQRALRVMPGGNSRHSTAIIPYPIYINYGKGSRVVDVEGEERIDFINNFTSLILGHADDKVTKAVQNRIERGTAFTLPSEVDIELAELLVKRVDYIDKLRFCNSGSEAVMLAVRAARAFSGRRMIAKFEGAFHGIYDYVQVSQNPTSENWGPIDTPATCIESSMASTIKNDVHDNIEKLREALKIYKDRGVETAIFLGDFCSPIPARVMGGEFPGKIHCVFGNGDGDPFTIKKFASTEFPNLELHGIHAEIEFDGVKVAITHYPFYGQALARTGDYAAVFSGHTHQVNEERFGECLWLNPGEVMGWNGRSTCEIYDTSSNTAEIVDL